MSTASISYSSLNDASNEAKSVAKKLDKYADSLYDNVYKKLNSYDGSWSSNLSSAKSKTNAKITELRSEKTEYETYATNLTDLRDECKSVDKAVRSKVSSLTASFKETHGIRNSKVENAISYFFTGLGNKTKAGRWLGGKKDDFNSEMNHLKDSIKEWYNYDGGKEFIKGVLVGLLEVAIGVLAIVGAILSGGALLVVIAGVVGGIIAVANGIANIANEGAALSIFGDDPATGRRRSKINSIQDYLRSSFIFDDDGETYHYNEAYQSWATGIDVTSFVCTAITLVSSVGKLVNRGLKWANGAAKIPFKDYFKPSTYGNFFQKAWGGLSNGGKELFASMKAGDWSFLKVSFKNFKLDFADNFKQKFLNFDSFKDGAKSTKSILGIGKDLIKGNFSLDTIGTTVMTKIVLPCVTVFKPNDMTIQSDKKIYLYSPIGQMKIDFKPVVMNDFYSIFDDTNTKVINNSLFKMGSNPTIVLEKLTSPAKINVSVPIVDIPNLKIPNTMSNRSLVA